jgi:hypothetical protein
LCFFLSHHQNHRKIVTELKISAAAGLWNPFFIIRNRFFPPPGPHLTAGNGIFPPPAQSGAHTAFRAFADFDNFPSKYASQFFIIYD